MGKKWKNEICDLTTTLFFIFYLCLLRNGQKIGMTFYRSLSKIQKLSIP